MTTNNLILNSQKLIFNILKNIESIKNNNTGVYLSVPNNVNFPYLKIETINITNKNISSGNSFKIDFCVSIISDEKNNKKVLEIAEDLRLNLPNYIGKIYDNLQIKCFLDTKITIEEKIEYQNWKVNLINILEIQIM